MASNPNSHNNENQEQEVKYWSWANADSSGDKPITSHGDVEMFGTGLLHEISKANNLPAPTTNPYQHQLDRKKAAEWKNKPVLSPGRMLQDDVPQDIAYDGFQPFQPGQTVPARKGHESITKKVSQYLLQTYVTCNPNYSYQPINNPRRVLTKPSVPAGNDGYDNEDCDYILYVNDIMGSKVGHQYQIIDALGAGTFGQVVKCQNIKTKEFIALKVIKNKPAYYNQSLVEVAILELVNKQHDPQGKHHLVRMRDSFVFRNHLCIAFEMLSVNLYELIKQNQFRGLSTNLIRVFTTQILDALTTLYKAKLIHCDLKPENILLKSLESPSIKVIDLGSACHENQTVYTYIQSRFYRSPEVLLGLPYTSSVDIWSLGCIAAELFLGLPLFPGSSEYNQMSRIIELLGNPPNHMCDKGKNGPQYFNKSIGEEGKYVYTLKSMEQYMRDQGTKEQPSKRYFQGNSLPEIINSYPIMRKGLSSKEIDLEMQNRRSFIDFLSGLLRLNPLERWTPQQASQHPFITQKPFLEPYVPHRYAAQSQPDTPHPLRHKSGTVRQDGAYGNIASDQSAVDSRYNQVVGTFSEFHIKSNPPAVTSDQSMATKAVDYPVHSQSLNTSQAYNHHQYLAPSQAQSHGGGGPGFPIRKAKSHFAVSGSYGRTAQQNLQEMHQQFTSSPGMQTHYYGEEYIEGHPRYGDQGERVRIPSRMPSASESVDWEMFKDYRGGASVAGSYASSRQGSFADIPSGQSHEQNRRPSFNSPGSYRQMGFQGRKMGSFSNDSFVNESHNYKQSDSNRRGSVTQDGGYGSSQYLPGSSSSSVTNSPRQFHKTHKKVKSTSSFGSPIIDPSVASRRPSVPNILLATAAGQGSSTLPSPLQSSSGQIPHIGYGNTSKSLQGYHFDTEKKEPEKEGSEFSTSRPIDLPNSKKR